jgi:hypothetical protein
MSAIGSYAVLRRRDFAACLDRARNIRSESSGTWLFKKTVVVGVSEFNQAWQAALVEEVNFDYSGYVLGNYLDAQLAVNQIQLADEQSEVASTLCKVFTAAFPFDAPVTLRVLASEPLLVFCQQEYGNEHKVWLKVCALHTFFKKKGLSTISSENLVIFIIR